ncbi:MAG: ABC-F family ATP-binding cassette domain-containing protein [Rikenellaceae bacterium]|jgi:ATP-binding cassette subfamily F protein uup|nr:ABC-F family ATP-binding cassette domain-containing protein [Rikenellaceae bacterium]
MVPYIQLEAIGKSFGDLVLYRDIDMTLGEGQRVALVAKNGAGKTTLLNIIAGKEAPDAGQVIFRNELRIGYLEQEPELAAGMTVLEAVYRSGGEVSEVTKAYEQALESNDQVALEALLPEMEHLGAWDYEYRAKAILTKLRITKLDQLAATLSGGERKRVALAAVLIDDPDVLILDEPTNHLDLDMVEWLEDFLIKSGKTLLLVTHDRYFLDRLCSDIYELDQKQLQTYHGGYADYIAGREERIARFHAEADRAQNLYRHELEWMRRMPQARGHKAKYRKDAFYETKDKAFRKRDEGRVRMNIKADRLGTKILEVKHLSKSFGEKRILDDFSYTFTRYEKLGIVGKNGTGKTTFLNLLTGTIKPDKGEIDIGDSVRFGCYTQQGMVFEEDKKVIDVAREVAEVVTLGDGRTVTVSQFLNLFLFPPETQQTHVRKLSGGERRRLYLLTILMQRPNFLILDEPTNDLDLMTLNVLEEYLTGFGGCIMVVSHDRYFMDKVAEQLLVFEDDGRIRTLPGNYTQYRNDLLDRETAAFPAGQPVEKSKPENPKTADRPRKMTFREKEEFSRLETEVTALEEEKAFLESELSSGNLTPEKLREYSERIGGVIAEIDEKSTRWLELSEL